MINTEILEKSKDLVDRSFTGALGTINEEGFPQIKAMLKTQANGLKEFWFCSNTSSKRATQIRKNSNACLYFCDEKTYEGLMLSGQAELSYDDGKRNEFWKEDMRIYYPQGSSDPDFVLIHFTAVKGNYYHGLQNTDFTVEA